MTDFWGDAIEIDDDAVLTWMRQAHITWDRIVTPPAGLVISTGGYLHLKHSETELKIGSISLNQVVARHHLSQP